MAIKGSGIFHSGAGHFGEGKLFRLTKGHPFLVTYMKYFFSNRKRSHSFDEATTAVTPYRARTVVMVTWGEQDTDTPGTEVKVRSFELFSADDTSTSKLPSPCGMILGSRPQAFTRERCT